MSFKKLTSSGRLGGPQAATEEAAERALPSLHHQLGGEEHHLASPCHWGGGGHRTPAAEHRFAHWLGRIYF